MLFEAVVKSVSSFPDVEFGAFGTMNNINDWHLNCLVMFIWNLGPWTLTAVQMKGHILQFPWLHRVVAGVLVAGRCSFDHTSMSQLLVSLLYAVSGGWLKCRPPQCVPPGDSSLTG